MEVTTKTLKEVVVSSTIERTIRVREIGGNTFDGSWTDSHEISAIPNDANIECAPVRFDSFSDAVKYLNKLNVYSFQYDAYMPPVHED